MRLAWPDEFPPHPIMASRIFAIFFSLFSSCQWSGQFFIAVGSQGGFSYEKTFQQSVKKEAFCNACVFADCGSLIADSYSCGLPITGCSQT